MKVSQSCLFQGSSSVFINRRFSSTVRPIPHKLHVTSTDRMLKRKPLDETLRSGLGKSDIRPFDGTGLMVSPEPKKNSKPWVPPVAGLLAGIIGVAVIRIVGSYWIGVEVV